MDERLEKALDFSNFMITVNNQQRVLKEKFIQDLIFYHNGGQFSITKELISFCSIMLNKQQKQIVLTDDNEIPIQIDDLGNFFDQITDQFTQANNSYLNDYNLLRKKRSVEFVIS